MDVNGVGSTQGSFPVKPNRTQGATPPKTSEAKPIQTDDQVEISTAGRMMDRLQESSEMRSERLAQIKTAIDAGKYDTPEKLEAALSKMLDEIESEK